MHSSQGSHSKLLMTGRSDRGSYFIPKKSQLQNLSTQKITTFLAYPKKSLSPFFAVQKNPSVFFFATQKNPGVFHRPQKITLGQNFRPKKFTRTRPSLKYVSGAPGALVHLHMHTFSYRHAHYVTKLNWLDGEFCLRWQPTLSLDQGTGQPSWNSCMCELGISICI